MGVMMADEQVLEGAVVGREVGAPTEVRSVGGMPLAELYRSQFEPMTRLATAMLGDRAEAEDVVQEAFIAVGRSLGSVTGSEVAYLRRAVVNGCRGSVRRGRARKRQPLRPVPDVGLEPEATAAERADHDRILGALDALSDRQRQCLVLRYYAGLTDAEIADAVGIHVGSAKTHLRRGLDALRSSLEDLR
jgi:RNA polymerase sigma factor (sigma-70 family)